MLCVHEAVPPLLLQTRNETNEPTGSFECNRRTMLIDVQGDRVGNRGVRARGSCLAMIDHCTGPKGFARPAKRPTPVCIEAQTTSVMIPSIAEISRRLFYESGVDCQIQAVFSCHCGDRSREKGKASRFMSAVKLVIRVASGRCGLPVFKFDRGIGAVAEGLVLLLATTAQRHLPLHSDIRAATGCKAAIPARAQASSWLVTSDPSTPQAPSIRPARMIGSPPRILISGMPPAATTPTGE